jgi:hypothetical protein
MEKGRQREFVQCIWGFDGLSLKGVTYVNCTWLGFNSHLSIRGGGGGGLEGWRTEVEGWRWRIGGGMGEGPKDREVAEGWARRVGGGGGKR